jgi:hypothetical protein
VIFFLTFKTDNNGIGGCLYRFVTADFAVTFLYLKPWLDVCCPLPNVVSNYVLQFCNVYLFDKEIRCDVQAV